ncbi:penicillin-binding protein 1C [uncultured Croceitalea sp.]|uniref:penicillin-binding protein 1C n=1 Tax=uncultured Croceitalea sp. TaxID=1798908 RepID=UPI0033059343
MKLGIFLVLLLLWLFCLPKQLFTAPSSTVVNSANGNLIGARIAQDGQWRFPKLDSVPKRFKQCVLLFEDEYFYQHPGFNPISIFNAIRHNLTQKSRRGGSTITQQVIRLSRKNQSRTYFEKLIEIVMATRLEFRYSKDEILQIYASNTPYGGNVVGLETASWRYFGIQADELSWGQAAALAVLPNAPSLIFPGRNDPALLKKRNRLLKKLRQKEILDQTSYELALLEPLPDKPLALPNIAPHLTERVKKEHPNERIKTSIDFNLQQQANTIAKSHYKRLKSNEINNLSILVLDIKTRKVLAYVGNSPSGENNANFVDIITKKRSTGSTLKPILFASLLDEGQLLPSTLVEDIPTVINGYNPKNFNRKHMGVVPANQALSRSLNVPAVRLLRKYGLQKFYNKLKKMNVNALDRSAGHYGLSLILGGAESSLWELTQTYAAMAAGLNHFTQNSSVYRTKEYIKPSYLRDSELDFGEPQFETAQLSAGAIYHTFKALREVNRPQGEENWQFFDSSQPLAWKTGTSFGFKDAWAVGVTPKYAIGVWAGNADGEGRPGLTGITAAAPILFDVLDRLPYSGWFKEPFDDLVELEVCKESGHRASVYCDTTTKKLLPVNGTKSAPCPYHKTLHLDHSASYQVNTSCYPIEDITTKNWFVLPAVAEYYYTQSNTDYKPPPPFLKNCTSEELDVMEFLYPKRNETVLLPKDLGVKTSEVVFKLAHQQRERKVFWYLDERFIGETQDFHELLLPISEGIYQLTAVDDEGNQIKQQLSVQMASKN